MLSYLFSIRFWRWILLIFAAFIIFFVTRVQLNSMWLNWQTQDYVPVPAVVHKLEFVKEGKKVNIPEISYIYKIKDKPYVGTVIAYEDGLYLQRFPKGKEAQKKEFSEAYGTGKAITVYVDPQHPELSVIEKGISARQWFSLLYGLFIHIGVLFGIWWFFWSNFMYANDRFLCEDTKTGFRIRMYSGAVLKTFIFSIICIWISLAYAVRFLQYDDSFYVLTGLVICSLLSSIFYTWLSEERGRRDIIVDTHYGTMDLPSSNMYGPITKEIIYLYNIDAVLINRFYTGDKVDGEAYILQLQLATPDRRNNERTLGTHWDKKRVQQAADWLGAKLGVPVEAHRRTNI